MALSDCLRIASAKDSIVLIENGVLGALSSSPCSQQLHAVKVYALMEDCQARGIDTQLIPEVVCIDYAEFVALCTRHQHVQSWF